MAGQDQRLVIAGLNAQLGEAEAAAKQFFAENQSLRSQVGRLKEMNIMVQLVCAVESSDNEHSQMSPSEVIQRADQLMSCMNDYFRQKVEKMQAEAKAAAEAAEQLEEGEGPQVDGDANLVGQEPPSSIITPDFQKPEDDAPGADSEGAD